MQQVSEGMAMSVGILSKIFMALFPGKKHRVEMERAMAELQNARKELRKETAELRETNRRDGKKMPNGNGRDSETMDEKTMDFVVLDSGEVIERKELQAHLSGNA